MCASTDPASATCESSASSCSESSTNLADQVASDSSIANGLKSLCRGLPLTSTFAAAATAYVKMINW